MNNLKERKGIKFIAAFVSRFSVIMVFVFSLFILSSDVIAIYYKFRRGDSFGEEPFLNVWQKVVVDSCEHWDFIFFVFQSVVNDLLCLFLPKALFSCIFSRHTGYVCLLYALA